ncbi:MAG: DNA polymerase III subunit delta [Lachnospiraceae bacterium]|nr:DNA polymerase III subunit delta [Lachnospiraceae bacterium]
MPKFKDIVGQQHIKMQVKSAIEEGRVGHAYIISGERFCGKEFLARTLAQTLVCEKGGTEPCGECHACILAEHHNHPDIVTVTHEDHPNSIGVDEVRDQIVDDVIIRPYSAPYKIYLVPEAEKMTPQAQNALLKTLEEPPAYVVIMLLTTATSVFLPTVRSRCEELAMKPVSDGELRRFLMEVKGMPDYHTDMCVAYAQGNVGKALQLNNSDEFETIRKAAMALVKKQHEMPLSEKISLVQSMAKYKMDPEEFLDVVLVWYRDVLLYKATGEIERLVNASDLAVIRKVADRCSYEGIEEVLEAIEKAKARLRANVNFEMTMELLLMTMQEKG